MQPNDIEEQVTPSNCTQEHPQADAYTVTLPPQAHVKEQVQHYDGVSESSVSTLPLYSLESPRVSV